MKKKIIITFCAAAPMVVFLRSRRKRYAVR